MTATAPAHVRVRRLLAATHPEPAALVTGVAAALAVATGRDLRGVLAVTAAVLAGQLSVGWCNDYVDRDRDALAGRRDKPLVRGDVSPGAVRRAAGGALLASVPLSLLSGLAAGSLHVAAVASAWAYDLRLKATAWSVLPYIVSFALLPVYVVLGRPGAGGYPLWLPASGSLLGAAAHFANVLPDLDADLATGVRGLPHRIGAAASRTVAGLLLLADSVVLALGPPGPPGWAGAGTLAAVALLVGAGAVAARRGGSRAAFRAVLLVAAVDVALLLARGSALS